MIKKSFHIIILSLFFVSSSLFSQVDTLRIATYNLLKFGTTAEDRLPYFRTVLNAIDADILVTQEMVSDETAGLLLSDALGDGYIRFAFVDGNDTDNSLYYRKEKLSAVSSRQIGTDLRDISEYILSYNHNPDAPYLYVYSSHLKASQGSDNEQRRLAEAIVWRSELDKLYEDANFFVCGDFNLYDSYEPAFQELTKDGTGQCLDPINMSGNWHNNQAFARIHTQSTRTSQFGGGASGGLDDRFDFILTSDDILDTLDYCYLEGTYTAFGNDANHFNGDINTLPNNAVPDSIADALYYASDHLPVYLDFTIHMKNNTNAKESFGEAYPEAFILHQNYPNPFNSETKIPFAMPESSDARLTLYDLQGKEIAVIADRFFDAGNNMVSFNATRIPSGLYIYRLEHGIMNRSKKMIILK